MFGGHIMGEGNLNENDEGKVLSVLQALSKAMSNIYITHRLTRDQTPFLRPSNLICVLAVDQFHLVVDNVAIPGAPYHRYIDQRELGTPIPLKDIVESARGLGFSRPIGISLPISVLDGNENTLENAIIPLANNICIQLAEAGRIERLDIPQGFQHLRRYLADFLRDHPDPDSNVFLMMRFKDGIQYDSIKNVLKEKFGEFGLFVLRADDKDYTGDLWENVCLYMIGCKYGIAVFDEIDEREFNPSVALELGFMMAHDKRCLILKDKRMPKMPTDIVGKLYKLFDTYDIEQSISIAVESWANDIGLSH